MNVRSASDSRSHSQPLLNISTTSANNPIDKYSTQPRQHHLYYSYQSMATNREQQPYDQLLRFIITGTRDTGKSNITNRHLENAFTTSNDQGSFDDIELKWVEKVKREENKWKAVVLVGMFHLFHHSVIIS